MRSVVHWDADRFFASIEQAADRRLRGRPLAVGGASRGVVLSASGEARRFSVFPGLPMRKARRLCPGLIVLPAHFELYEQFFGQILGLCHQTTPLVEPLAVGAAYLDLTGTRALLGADAATVVERLRQTVREWLRVSLSTGIAANKLVARMAARLRKPHGQVMVPAGEEAAFLAPRPLGWLPGIGPQTQATLEVAGMTTVGELARAPLDALELVLHRRALPLQRLAQGVDEEPVRPRAAAARSFQESVDFAEDAWEEPLLLDALRALVDRLMARVRAGGVEVRRLSLEVRYTDRAEDAGSVTLAEPTAVETDFYPHLNALLRGAWRRRVRLRALTLRATRLYRPSPQMSLFETAPLRTPAALAAAIDALRRLYGENAVQHGWKIV